MVPAIVKWCGIDSSDLREMGFGVHVPFADTFCSDGHEHEMLDSEKIVLKMLQFRYDRPIEDEPPSGSAGATATPLETFSRELD